MKTIRFRILWGLGMFAVLFQLLGKVGFSQDKSAESMNTRIARAEDSWNHGDQAKYYSNAAALAKEIKANSSKTNLNEAALKMLGSLLLKRADPKVVDADDLFAMRDLATYLGSIEGVSIDDRRSIVSSLCRYLGKVRTEEEPNFKPLPVTTNVAPPPGIPGMAGMSPNAIKDPATRAKYEAAIQENADNARQNRRQHVLRDMDWAMSKRIKNYMLKTFRSSDVSTPDFQECQSAARFDDQERKEIQRRLK